MHSPVSPAARRGLFSSAVVLGLLLCAGCDSKAAAAPGALAVIVGAHSNMVAPSLLDNVEVRTRHRIRTRFARDRHRR